MSKLYDILLRPIVTEKSNALASNNVFSFKVSLSATKKQIKTAVENIFKAEIEHVNVINVKGKIKRFRNRIGQRSDYKKALVTLKKGAKIDMNVGI